MIEAIKAMQESDLAFAISENGAEIVIKGTAYPCVASSHDESRDQGEDALGFKIGFSCNVTLRRDTYKGGRIDAGKELVRLRRHGQERVYRVSTYGESASGHAILLSLDALRS